MSGNSTTPCPIAMSAPAVLFFTALVIVTANKGPGRSTPDKEMNIIDVKKSGKS
ncbi:MAG: hypothetical protein QXP44_00980 [Candidatus Bathyarchaeia archaeon]